VRSVADMTDKTVTREDQMFVIMGYVLDYIKYQNNDDFPKAIVSYNQARAKFMGLLNAQKS